MSSRKNKRYCARAYAGADWAAKSMRKSRAKHRQAKIERARRAVGHLEGMKRQPSDWTKWVARRIGATSNFVTRNYAEITGLSPVA